MVHVHTFVRNHKPFISSGYWLHSPLQVYIEVHTCISVASTCMSLIHVLPIGHPSWQALPAN